MSARNLNKIPRPYTELGEILAKARVAAGLTQRAVSLELEYSSPQFISNFERGIAVPPLKKLRILCKLYSLAPRAVIEPIIKAERMRLVVGLGGLRAA